jgi:cell division protein FtsB
MARKAAKTSTQEKRSAGQKSGVARQVFTNTRLVTVLLLSSLFLIAMMVLTIWGEHGLLEMWRRQHNNVRLAREVDAIEHENARLAQEIQRLHGDMSYIEKIAREELGLVRPGELVFEFVE